MAAIRADELKPVLRGQLHRAAFWAYLGFTVVLLKWTREGLPRLSLAIYLITLINLYCISSILHTTDWEKLVVETRVQRIDHASIFLLIAGTYTPLCLNCLPFQEMWPIVMLISVWIIAIAGVVKCLVWSHLSKAFNVAFYFICGLTIIPFLPLIVRHISPLQLALLLGGGGLYLTGGVIYGTEYPDPFPTVFGYHEIFHTLTILANLCFLGPICDCVFS